jgi:hypothetical protein
MCHVLPAQIAELSGTREAHLAIVSVCDYHLCCAMAADAVEILGGLPSTPSVVHHLPCRIVHDGPAKVSTYFIVNTGPDGTH